MTRSLALTVPATALAGGDDLSVYFREVGRFPLLTADEERELAERWRSGRDAQAAKRLVLSNLRFVVKVAFEYRRYGLRMADLIQEGNLGLLIAVRKFDPARGVRLISYAVWWIRAMIQEFILRSWSMVRMGASRAERRLFRALQAARNRTRIALGAEHPERAAQVRSIADETDTTPAEVEEVSTRLRNRDLSLDAPASADGRLTLAERIPDLASSQEDAVASGEQRALLKARMDEALSSLGERERLVFDHRIASDEPSTLAEVASLLGVSRERVRQIEERLKEKLRARLADVGVEFLAA